MRLTQESNIEGRLHDVMRGSPLSFGSRRQRPDLVYVRGVGGGRWVGFHAPRRDKKRSPLVAKSGTDITTVRLRRQTCSFLQLEIRGRTSRESRCTNVHVSFAVKQKASIHAIFSREMTSALSLGKASGRRRTRGWERSKDGTIISRGSETRKESKGSKNT